MRHGNGGQVKSFGDVSGFDDDTFSTVKVRGERSGFYGFVLLKVEDAADGGFDGAC
jgi:hypothetical protein